MINSNIEFCFITENKVEKHSPAYCLVSKLQVRHFEIGKKGISTSHCRLECIAICLYMFYSLYKILNTL